ncbi:MAG: deoxynucleoside kinase, partial [Mucinivorans sp.]
GKNAIVDRTIDEDAEVFARNLHEFGILEPRDWHAYKQLYDYTAGALPQADILIYLRASSNTLVRHISRRGRDYESSIDQHYLDNLNILYEQWIASYSGRIVVVDVDEDDFVEDAPTRERVLNEICSQI